MFWHKSDRDMRTSWGYTFEWTPHHLTREQMRPLTFTYDELGSKCLDRLDELSPPKKETKSPSTHNDEKMEGKSHSARRDLYALLEQQHTADPKLHELWSQLHTVPAWVDWTQIKQGQDVFYRYGGPAIISLTFQSLVGGMAGGRVIETLSRTGGFDVKIAKRRLLETFQHILQVTQSPESLRPGGQGFASSVRVRLLHASVRRRILSLARDRPAYFDLDEWGVPVNDLDSIGTILSFSAALVWIGLPRQGIWLREDEIVDYTALWRYVAYLLGTPTDPWLVDYRQARVLLESLIVAELRPTEMSRTLANNILTGLSNQPPTNASREFLCAEAWWLNGRELSEALGIEKPRLLYRALVAGQCLYFMCVNSLYRAIPSWDEAKNERARKFLYKMTVENRTIGLGQETFFEFKYVPQFGLTTLPGRGGGGGSKDATLAVGSGPSERRGLTALVFTSALVGTVAWFGLRPVLGSMGVVRW